MLFLLFLLMCLFLVDILSSQFLYQYTFQEVYTAILNRNQNFVFNIKQSSVKVSDLKWTEVGSIWLAIS
ncbi:MAG: hypothetical protein RMJ67_09040 [Elusimicrobiota bacterium]|nr:hypothetical protein [Endomicrobiia bacterium]MDW8166642.1 hypothetical protein [Elusimicrobiota bacterium]